MSRNVQVSLTLALMLMAPFAAAQSDLGALLDRGATKLSPDEFKEYVVQTVLTGRTESAGNVEVMYAASGVFQGVGTHPLFTGLPLGKIYGEWAIDGTGRVCTTNVRIGKISLIDRCHYWFRYDDQFFVSDSDSDRSTLAFSRTVKR